MRSLAGAELVNPASLVQIPGNTTRRKSFLKVKSAHKAPAAGSVVVLSPG